MVIRKQSFELTIFSYITPTTNLDISKYLVSITAIKIHVKR